MKKPILLLSILIAAATFADVYDEIGNAIRTGDAKQIANFFSSSIDLTILNQEDVYSKSHAEILIKDFFSKNPPKSFTVVHKGSSKEGTLFAVGNLTTKDGKTYRTSFVLKSNQGKYLIQELRFENQ